MNMKKQLLLLIMMLLSMMAMADNNGTCGDNLTWTFVESTGTLTVSGSGAMQSDVTRPWENIKDKILAVVIEDGVTTIGGYAFRMCSALASIVIPNSVTSIGDSSFESCSNLASVVIPNSVTSIGQYAFSHCRSLTTITIGNSVASIGDNAFYDCIGLTSVTIPSSVTSIGTYIFQECSSLTSINVETENNVYDSRNNCNAIIETSTNTLLFGCINTVIPNDVTSIGQGAFYKYSELTSIAIPNGVTSIGANAFHGCSGLTSIAIPNSVTSIGIYAFHGCSGLTSINIPNGVTYLGSDTFHGCSGLTSINIPSSVTFIGSDTFCGCCGLTSINIPNSVTYIGSYTFQYCSGLTSITIGNSVTSIGNFVFSGCSSLIDVFCYAENVPSTAEYALNGFGIANATLHVPDASIELYKTTAPWKNFKEIVGLGGTEPQKCATPTIQIVDGIVTFECGTEGVTYKATYQIDNIVKNIDGKKDVLGGTTNCTVSVYATKEGYEDSDVATANVEVAWGKKGDANADGVVNVADLVTTTNIIMGKDN